MINQTDTSLPPPMATDSLEIIWAQPQATTGCHLVNIGSKTHMNEHISLISSCLELTIDYKDSNTSTLGQRQ